jgi:outer membrane protein W
MSDCPSIFNDIDKTKLTPESLTSITEKYHNKTCTSYNCIVFEKKQSESIFHWGPFVQLNNVNFHFISDIPSYDHSYTINAPAIGLKTSFMFPWLSEKFAVEVASAFSSVKFNDKYADDALATNDTKISLSYQNVDVLLGFKYLFMIKKVRPNIGVGLDYDRILNYNSTITRYLKYPDIKEQPYQNVFKQHLGYYINAGVDYMITGKQFISLSLIYSRVTGGDQTLNYYDHLKQLGLQLGYNF